MADAGENLQGDERRRNYETESRSIEETKGATPDLMPSESERRSDERRYETESSSCPKKKENEDSGLRINETGQICDDKYPDAENMKQQRLSDFEMRHETESRFWHPKRHRSMDWRGRREYPNQGIKKDCPFYQKTGQCHYGKSCYFNHPTYLPEENEEMGQIRDHKYSDAENLQQQRLRDADMRHETESRFRNQKRDRSMDWKGRSESRWRFGERRQELMQYPNRGSEKDCPLYLKKGYCRYGNSCYYNHPSDSPQEFPERTGIPTCKYFLRGECQFGSACVYYHPKDMDGTEPMHQARTRDCRVSESEWRFDARRHETESRSRPEKKAKTIPDFGEPDYGQIEFDFEREIVEDLRERVETQRREALGNLQVQRPRERLKYTPQLIDGIAEGYKQAKRREQIEKQRRESQDNLQEQRRYAQENLQQQRLRGMPEDHNVDAHDQQYPQEQIQRDIDEVQFGEEGYEFYEERGLRDTPKRTLR